MRADLTAEQELFRQTSRSFLERETPLTKVRELADDPSGFDRDWWRRAAELGWTSLLIPEEHGGGSSSGEGLLDLVIVAEEIGRRVAPGPFVPTNVVATAVAESGNSQQRDELLPAIAAGETVASWCTGELEARRSNGSFVLSGTAPAVEAAAQADQLLVTTATDEGPTQFLVPTDTSGLVVEPLESLDFVKRFAAVRFDGATVASSAAVGAVGGAGLDVERQLQLALVLQCAESAGAAARVLEFTVEYVTDRFAFGRPLASYQALKHRFADMKTWVEACHAIVDGAAQAVQSRRDSAATMVSAAKAYVGERATEIIQDCVQMHGGIGVTWEHDLHLYLRRAAVNRSLHGTPTEHRERIAARVGLHGANDEAAPETSTADRSAGVDANDKEASTPVASTRAESDDLAAFRRRARAWLAENMPRLESRDRPTVNDKHWARNRELQRQLWDGGFAGICFPKEYGGLGLPPEYQRAFTQESLDYELPTSLNVPTFSILAVTLLDFGTETQKQRHIPAILRGEEIWVQFLSEPTGGSDLAGCLTRADRDGDIWVLRGSKIWSSSAYVADYAMCLARTDWNVPKHQGLTMFIVDIHQPGVQVEQIKMVNGEMEFCQEFFDDVAIPAENVIGEVNDGWRVASALLVHEHAATGGASPYASGVAITRSLGQDEALVELANTSGQADEASARQLVAEARMLNLVQRQFIGRVTEGINAGTMNGHAMAMLKLYGATTVSRQIEIGLALAGEHAVGWVPGTPLNRRFGQLYLMRQGGALAGGSNEIQRNIISERVLGMPREWSADREMPFRDVRTNRMPTRAAAPAER